MPTYDYDCSACGQTFEIFQSMSAPPVEACPNCGGKVQRRIYGGAGLIFKGTGFYLTDYKKQAASGANGKDETSGAKSKPASEKKSSEKPVETTTKKTEAPSTS